MNVLMFFLVLAVAVSPARADVLSDPMIAEVRALHDAAIDGGKKQAEAAEAKIRALAEAHPDNQVLRVYLGSILTIRSAKAFPGPAKFRYLKEGLETMDAAVEAVPGNPIVRFIRAMNHQNLPGFIGRNDDARRDFKKLLRQMADPAVRERLADRTRQAIHYYAGLALREKDGKTALRSWKEGLAIDPTSDIGQKIARQLARARPDR